MTRGFLTQFLFGPHTSHFTDEGSQSQRVDNLLKFSIRGQVPRVEKQAEPVTEALAPLPGARAQGGKLKLQKVTLGVQ